MNPKAFVSYSWDSEEHKTWVADLSKKLRNDGVETILDQWHVVPGEQLPQFMEREIRNNDYALIICTPKYKLKSNARSGGVGYEGDIMTAEVFSKSNHKKYIPILCSGEWTESSPSWLAGKYYIDLSTPDKYEQGYKDLITTIHGHRVKAPPVGKKPSYLSAENIVSDSKPKEFEDISIEGVVIDEVTTPKSDGTRGSALYKVPFQLSRTPSSLWARAFVSAWNHPTSYSTMHRPGIAHVRGSKVYLDGTSIEEIERYHRDTLLLSVDAANTMERSEINKKMLQKKSEDNRKKEHRESVISAASRLKF